MDKITNKYLGYILFIFCFAINAINLFLIYNFEKGIPVQTLLYILGAFYIVVKCKKNNYKKISINKLAVIVLFCMILIVFFVTYNRMLQLGVIKLGEYQNISYISSITYYWNFFKERILMYFIYIILAFEFNNIIKLTYKSKIVRKINFIILTLIVLLIFYTAIQNSVSITETVFLPDVDNGFYLQIGDCLAVYFLYLIFTSEKKYILAISSIILLYKIGSRTSLYVMIITLIMCQYMFLNIRNIYKKMAIIIFSTIFSVLAMVVIVHLISISNLDFRMISVLLNKSLDGSYQARNYIEQVALADIRNIWFTGYLFREIFLFGNPGYYIHNILSFWVSYGFIPFILLIGLVLNNLKKIILNLKYLDKYNYSLIGIFIFLLIESLVSRSYYYPCIWFCTYLKLQNYNED